MKPIKDIDAYISQFPDDKVQATLRRIRKEIKSVVPKNSVEAIKYGIPTFRLDNINVVHFGAFKGHISFFPTSSPIPVFKTELGKYNVSKGTIQFQLEEKIPYDLIKKITKFRIKQIKEKRK